MKTCPITELSYHEFEELVRNTYGLGTFKYSFVATEECGNDSVHRFSVPEKQELDEYERESLDAIIATGYHAYSNYVLFQDLVNKDILPSGEYLVSVCW